MAYRSDPAAIGPLAEPLLSWGVAAGKPVRIALEAGPVAPETEERFRPAAAGRIAVEQASGATRALLLAQEGQVAGAKMFASQGRITVEPARISFLGDEARMCRTQGSCGPHSAPGAPFRASPITASAGDGRAIRCGRRSSEGDPEQKAC
jgi:hypothetical protein